MNTTFISFALIVSLAISALQAQPLVELQEIADGFTSPTDIVSANDPRLFIVERPGTVRILDGERDLLASPFLDISDRVIAGGERGLLGLAFHPAYPDSPYVYVNYTAAPVGDTRISRFSLNPADSNDLDEDSERILLAVDQPFGNHNAGDLEFGPDGYLYIPLGDGGSANDPMDNAQNRQSLLGKMLRIDVDNGNPYAIPEDNPFAMDDQTLDEIWAIGLRNPWRISFDDTTGALYIADVGQNVWEEINVQSDSSTGGENYGWRCYEANDPYIMSGDCPDMSQVTFPAYAYEHNAQNGCSVVGGFVYRGSSVPQMYSRYVYGDFCSGQLWTLFRDSSGIWQNEELLEVPDGQLSTFGQDYRGELYLALLGSGEIHQLMDFCTLNRPDTPVIHQFGDTLIAEEDYSTYTWLLDSIVLPIANDTLDASPWGSGTYRLIVENEFGCEAVSNPIEVVITAIEEPEIEGLRVYPALTDAYLYIVWKSGLAELLDYRIIDSGGRPVSRGELNKAAGAIRVGDLKSGLYFLELSDREGRRLIHKFVRQ